MNYLLTYIKDRIGIIAINCFVFILFAVTFYLYRLPLEAVGYPIILCIIFELSVAVYDFTKYKAKHNKMQLLLQNIMVTNNIIKYSDSLIDQDYCNVINLLLEQRKKTQEHYDSNFNDINEYYTVWVHQIKTPIASMKLSLQHEDTKLSRKLSSELYRIEQYVQMVMAYLRMNAVSTDYLFVECDIDSLIKQAVKCFSTDFIEKKINLIYEPVNTRVVTDKKWLLFVLEQVISNSLKYSKKGYIKIYLDERLRLCIEDSGIGIASEDIPRIFENGYTGNIGRMDKKSSGIGLYLCKTVCDKLNINLSAQSTLGEGTRIMLDLFVTKM